MIVAGVRFVSKMPWRAFVAPLNRRERGFWIGNGWKRLTASSRQRYLGGRFTGDLLLFSFVLVRRVVMPPPVENARPFRAPPKSRDTSAEGLALHEGEHESDRYRPTVVFLVSGTAHLILLLVLALMVRPDIQRSVIVMTLRDYDVDDLPALEVLLVSDALTEQTDSPVDVGEEEFEVLEEIVEIEIAPPEFKPRTPRPSSQVSGNSGADAEAEEDAREAVRFFGTHAYGNKFVYVMDASGSMSSGDGGRIRRARAELIRSINALQPHHSFYVVLYNNRAIKMFDRNERAQLLEATRENKAHAARWITFARPAGSTMPAEALKIAGDLKPDAVFFLSDGEFEYEGQEGLGAAMNQFVAEFGQARPSVLKGNPLRPKRYPKSVLSEYAPEIIVHTIAFESAKSRAMMQRIAELKGGEHRYIPAPPRPNLRRKRN